MNAPEISRDLSGNIFAPSMVACPLKNRQEIGMGRCVENQRENGCHCEHALPSLRRIKEHLAQPGNRQAGTFEQDERGRAEALDEIAGLMERAEHIEKDRPPELKPPTLAETYRQAQSPD